MAEKSIIEVEGLTHKYGARTALADLSFVVRRGEIFGLLGPNGGGKTTLFRILSTSIVPTDGSARLFGLDVVRDRRYIRDKIGVVFQAPSLDRKLTARENLRHQGHLYGLRGSRLDRRIEDLLARFGLAERGDEIVEKLSGGLRRRLELAKALLHSPELLLLDEPSAGLDPGARLELWRYFEELRRAEGTTLLLTTHFTEEAERCDRVGILDRGRLVALSPPDELKAMIGGDVVSVEAREPERLRDGIKAKFGGEPTLLDGVIRIECQRGHEFIARLVEAFPGQIDTVSMHKPTLEDVFIRLTGRKLYVEPDQR